MDFRKLVTTFSKVFRNLAHSGKTVRQIEKHFSLPCMNVAGDFNDKIVEEIRNYVRENLQIELKDILVMSGLWMSLDFEKRNLTGRSDNFLQIIRQENGDYIGIAFFGVVKRLY